MPDNIITKAENWWKKNILSLPTKDSKSKKAKVRVKVKRAKDEPLSDKEFKAIKKALSGPFGRMDKNYDDIQ